MDSMEISCHKKNPSLTFSRGPKGCHGLFFFLFSLPGKIKDPNIFPFSTQGANPKRCRVMFWVSFATSNPEKIHTRPFFFPRMVVEFCYIQKKDVHNNM